MDMKKYVEKIHLINIMRQRKRQQKELCADQERASYLVLTRFLPQAAYKSSQLKQSVTRLTFAHLCTGNKVLPEIRLEVALFGVEDARYISLYFLLVFSFIIIHSFQINMF